MIMMIMMKRCDDYADGDDYDYDDYDYVHDHGAEWTECS